MTAREGLPPHMLRRSARDPIWFPARQAQLYGVDGKALTLAEACAEFGVLPAQWVEAWARRDRKRPAREAMNVYFKRKGWGNA